ncbi:MAG: J domain-containing protein [Butyricicoccus pullicaecorum]|nr:J domain-containing protein [Butyricicoccus pullicaecorum]
MDPYKVLGITPQTSDDDVKRAYRELARKYHPDNYVNNPLADLAEARMKEINEAYDMIMNQRSGKASSQQTGYNDTYQQNTTDSGIYGKIRSAITSGNLAMAEEMLARLSGRDAEWYFLMGTIYFRKGWYDEAQRCYTQACSMDPANLEYKSALNNLNMGANYGGYRPMSTVSTCDCCTQLLCCNCLANCCCGGGC